MARTRTKESRDPSDPIVRVRGGHKGVRFIPLSQYKSEIKERKKFKIKRNDKLKEKKRKVK